MPQPSRSLSYYLLSMWRGRQSSVLLLGIFLAACASDGCDCDGFEQTPYPPAHYDKTVQLSAQVRLSSHGIDFLEEQVPTILAEFLPDGLSFCVPPGQQSAGVTIRYCHDNETCDDGSPGCQITMELENTELNPVPPNELHVSLTIGDVDEELPLDIGSAHCKVKLHKKSASRDVPARLNATLPIIFKIDNNSDTRDLNIEVGDLDLDVSDLDYYISGRGGVGHAIACGGVYITVKAFLDGFIRDMIADQLNDIVPDLIDEQLCMTCEDDPNSCPSNASCQDVSGDMRCMYNATNECVQNPLGVEGRLKFGELLGDYMQNDEANVDLMIKAADLAQANTGLTLAMRSGFQPERVEGCIPADPGDAASFAAMPAIPVSPTVNADMHPNGTRPFMIGFGLHKRTLDHMFWSTWASGALCLSITSETVDLLSTGTFGALLPSMRSLGDGNRAMKIVIAPQLPPVTVLGANRVVAGEVEEGLITLDWKDLDIHIYGYIQDRYARLFTMRADVFLPIAIVPDGDGGILPVLGDIEGAIQNVRPLSYEILAEDPQRIADLLPTLLGFALPALAGALDEPFELPEFVGFRIVLEEDDITSVDNNTFVALFANLEVAPPALYRAGLTTMVRHQSVDISRVLESGLHRPTVSLDLAAFRPASREMSTQGMEFSYRVNRGSWSAFKPSSSLVINDPMFVLQGKHRIDIRTRYQGDPKSTQLEPTTTHVMVDYERPELDISARPGVIVLAGSDAASKTEDLMYRYRIHDGQGVSPWSSWSFEDEVDISRLGLPELIRVEAEVRDEAGFVVTQSQSLRNQPVASTDTSVPTGGCGCASVDGGSGTGGALAMMLLFGLGLLIQRRRVTRRTWRLLALIGFLFTAACSSDISSNTVCAEDCAVGYSCQEGSCAPVSPCSSQEDCEEGNCIDGACLLICEEDSHCADECGANQFGMCVFGECECVNYCDQGCDEGQYCCNESNSCRTLPDPCIGKVCEPGFKPDITSLGTGNQQTCEVSGASCDCVSLPPLPLGWHGHYASVAVNGSVKAASVYNSTYSDLMVATLDANNEPTWYFVDGVPETGTIAGALDGPRGGIRDRGQLVGHFTATAVDDAGRIHVLYRDLTFKTLKYARGTSSSGAYSFEIVTLDATDNTGFWNSAVIVGESLHAVYSAREVDEDKSQIRHISFPLDANLDDLALEPTIIYTSDPPEEPLTPVGDPEVTGLFNELTITPDGLLVVFYDHVARSIAWARRVDDEWQMPEFLGIESGPYGSGRIDDDGNLHLAYMDPTTPGVVYWTPGSPAQLIKNGTRDTAMGWLVAPIGEDVKLNILSDGTLHVTFHDATLHVLFGATRTNGVWSVDPLGMSAPGAYTGAYGFYSTAAVSGDAGVAVEFVINNQADPTVAFPVFHSVP